MTEIRQAVLDFLVSNGVRDIFGNPGSSEVPLLDSLAQNSGLAYRLVLHESIAVAMADSYAQMTGSWGIVSVHVTPGVSNISGGLFLAQAHNSPVVVLAGQQDSRLLVSRPFLASDLARQARQYAKYVWQAQRPEDVLPALRDAMQAARTTPQGPVLVAVPKDFYMVETMGGDSSRRLKISIPGEPAADMAMTDAAADLIERSRRPVIMSGNGVGRHGSETVREVVALAELLGAPVYSEHNAVNMHFPNRHPQYLEGNAHGTERMNDWLTDADLLIAIGADLFMYDAPLVSELIPPSCKVVQIDDNPSEIARILGVDVAVHANVTDAVRQLRLTLENRDQVMSSIHISERREEIARKRALIDAERQRILDDSWDAVPIRMPRVYSELRNALDRDGIMIDEAVNMASYLHDFYELTEAGTLLSSKQSWLGWGWGAALGAQLAHPDRQVVAVLGDGSALYTPQALWTAKRYRLPITAIVLNNGGYMAVQNHLRELDGYAVSRNEYVGTHIEGVDFVGLAQSFGVDAQRVKEPSALPSVLSRSIQKREPTLVEVMIDPDDAGYGREPIPRG